MAIGPNVLSPLEQVQTTDEGLMPVIIQSLVAGGGNIRQRVIINVNK